MAGTISIKQKGNGLRCRITCNDSDISLYIWWFYQYVISAIKNCSCGISEKDYINH
jgi:hypothetical protein